MSADSKAQRKLLDALADTERRSSVRIARELDWSLVRTVRTCTMLAARGLVDRDEAGGYAITPAGVQHLRDDALFPSGAVIGRDRTHRAHLRGTLRERAWRAMRMQRRFTIHDVLAVASRPTDRDPERGLQNYLHKLAATGYLIREPHKAPGTSPQSRGYTVFRLVRDTGELPPSIRKDGTAHDRNEARQTPELAACREPTA